MNQSNLNIKRPLLLAAGEPLSTSFKQELVQMNADKPTFSEYQKRVQETFGLKPVNNITEKQKIFLGGFIEGEGSISISVKKNRFAPFGVDIDPNFNITQHVNGVNHLQLALEVFQTGRIRYKSGSNATLVFTIEPRKSLQEKVCPFLEKYVIPYSSPAKQLRYKKFKKMLDLFDQDAHKNKDKVINDLLPIWDSMRMQRGYSGETFASLQEAQDYVRNFHK